MAWKRSLWILWFANFSNALGFGLFVPFLPYFIESLGIHDLSQIEKWSGLIFAAQFMTAFLFQPVWGALGDRKGKKFVLLILGFGLAAVNLITGLSSSIWMLFILRLLLGMFTGFIPISISLQSAITPNEQTGQALGLLQTGGIAGSLLGPLIGGLLVGTLKYNELFFCAGGMLIITWLIVVLFVPKDTPSTTDTQNKVRGEWKQLKPLLPVFLASFITQLGVMSIEPIVTVYAKTLYHGSHLGLIAGLVFSITGIANLIGSPIMGKFSDRIGPKRILTVCLILSALTFIPQAMTHGITGLLFGRFLLGLFIGGMIPSLSLLVKRLAPHKMMATAFGVNTSSLFLGNLVGPLLGGHISAQFGITMVFYVTMTLLLINAGIVILQKFKPSVDRPVESILHA